MTAVYAVAIHKEPTSAFGVSVPDLPGCISAGATMAEAMRMVKHAIEFHLRGMEEDGEPIPPPTQVDRWVGHGDFADAMAWGIVEVDLPEPAALATA